MALRCVSRGWEPTDEEKQEFLTFLCGIIAEDSAHNTRSAQEMDPTQLLKDMLGPGQVTHSLKIETELSLKALSIKTLRSTNAYKRFKLKDFRVFDVDIVEQRCLQQWANAAALYADQTKKTNYDDGSLKLAFDTVSASFGINAENCAEVLTEVMRERRKTIIAYVLGVSKTLSPTTNGPTGIAAEKRRRVQASRGGHMVEQDLTRRSSPSSQSTSSLLTRSASCKRQRAIVNMSPILEPAQASSSVEVPSDALSGKDHVGSIAPKAPALSQRESTNANISCGIIVGTRRVPAKIYPGLLRTDNICIDSPKRRTFCRRNKGAATSILECTPRGKTSRGKHSGTSSKKKSPSTLPRAASRARTAKQEHRTRNSREVLTEAKQDDSEVTNGTRATKGKDETKDNGGEKEPSSPDSSTPRLLSISPSLFPDSAGVIGDEEEEFYSHSSAGSLPKLKNSRDLMEISGTRGQLKFENSIKEHMYGADGSEQKDSLGFAATITTPTLETSGTIEANLIPTQTFGSFPGIDVYNNAGQTIADHKGLAETVQTLMCAQDAQYSSWSKENEVSSRGVSNLFILDSRSSSDANIPVLDRQTTGTTWLAEHADDLLAQYSEEQPMPLLQPQPLNDSLCTKSASKFCQSSFAHNNTTFDSGTAVDSTDCTSCGTLSTRSTPVSSKETSGPQHVTSLLQPSELDSTNDSLDLLWRTNLTPRDRHALNDHGAPCLREWNRQTAELLDINYAMRQQQRHT